LESTRVNEDESLDGLFRNKVRVFQAVRGYRASEDAVILTWFVRPVPHEFILDAGTGCGVIAFGLAVKEPTVHVVGLEIQERMADRAQRGAALNSLKPRVSIVRGDLRQADRFFRPGCFDAVACNPPYHDLSRGRISMQSEKALARHQLMMPCADLFKVSRKLLKPAGRLCLIYPAGGLAQLRKAMQETGFSPRRMVWIHPRREMPPGLVCVEARPEGAPEGCTESSLIIYDEPGIRSARAQAVLAGEEARFENE
jgi:tRNA1Val (adenine37-N6)-methyltransferase